MNDTEETVDDLAVIAIVVITFAGFTIHRQIERRIDALEEL